MTQINEHTLVSFDWALKHLLRDKANFDVLEGFLSTLLEEEIRVVAVLESGAKQARADEMGNDLDLLALDSVDQMLMIKLQVSRQPAYLERLLYGASDLIANTMQLSDAFDDVRKVISIGILNFPISDDDEYLYHGQTTFVGINTGKTKPIKAAPVPNPVSKRGHLLLEYYVIAVAHFQNSIHRPIDEWVYLFKNAQVRDEFHSKNIQTAKETLAVRHLGERERKAYEQYQNGRANAMDLLSGQSQSGRDKQQTSGQAAMSNKANAA